MQNCRWGKETPQRGEQSPSEELTGSHGDAAALSRLGCGRHGGVGEVGGQPYGVFGTSTFSENHEDGGLSQRMRWVSNGLKLFLWPMCGEQAGTQPLGQRHRRPTGLVGKVNFETPLQAWWRREDGGVCQPRL